MALLLKQSTAVDIKVGPFLDSTDGNTAASGLTITQPDIRLAKNGGAFAQKNAAQTLSHEENGWYEVALDTTDTNTLGILTLVIHESGALQVWQQYMVVPANTYDSLVGGTDTLQADVTQAGGSAISAASGLLNANVTQISGDATAADNAEAAFDGTGYNVGGGSVVAASVTGAVGSVTGNVGGSVGSVTGAVGSVTGNVGGNVTGSVGSVTGNVTGSVGSLATQAKADVNAEVVDALNVDTYAEVSAPPAANAPLSQKIGWLFVLARNKLTQSSTTQTLRNDADSGDIATSAVSDNGTTFTRGEWS